MLGQGRVDARLGSGVGGAAQRQCDRPQPQFEQPIAACGLKVILPLRRRVTDQLDLPIVQPEPFIRGTALRPDRAIVGQQYALRPEIGKESSREKECQYVLVSGVTRYIKKKNNKCDTNKAKQTKKM